jgi:hypothetical protein
MDAAVCSSDAVDGSFPHIASYPYSTVQTQLAVHHNQGRLRYNKAGQMTQEILKVKQDLIDDVIEYMKYGGAVDENDPAYNPEFDAGYTQKHVDRLSEIIDDFLASLEKTPEAQKNEYIMDAVKETILRLNELNEGVDGSLIETDQREFLGKLINLAARDAGLESSTYDITYEWREW